MRGDCMQGTLTIIAKIRIYSIIFDKKELFVVSCGFIFSMFYFVGHNVCGFVTFSYLRI